jgi:hypothetical protein
MSLCLFRTTTLYRYLHLGEVGSSKLDAEVLAQVLERWCSLATCEGS